MNWMRYRVVGLWCDAMGGVAPPPPSCDVVLAAIDGMPTVARCAGGIPSELIVALELLTLSRWGDYSQS